MIIKLLFFFFRGLWNVPFVTSCYLINSTILKNSDTRPTYDINGVDPDMAFSYSNRDKDNFMFVSNRLDFGHLVNQETFNITLKNPEMYQLFDNKVDWENRYIHENYSKIFEPNYKPMQVNIVNF